MVVTINNAIVDVLMDSLTIDDAIEERSTCSFIIVDKAGVHYSQGQLVEIFTDLWFDAELWDDTLLWNEEDIIYAGFIDKPVEKRQAGTNITLHSITSKDMHYLADKRIVAKAYEDTLAGDIVKDLITQKLAEEGVTEGAIQDGPMVTEAVFNYITVSKALDSLAEKSNFIWYIDYDKKLYFMSRSTLTAPWTATAKDMRADTVTVERGNDQYRNTQYVKGGKDITDPLTENKIGDGNTRSWVVGFPIAKEPAMALNGTPIAASDIGIRGVETGKKYYWSKGDNTISQDEAETILTSSDTLSVTYQGEFNIIVKTFDESEISDRQTIEGNSGIVEDVADEMNSTTREAAFEIANAKIQKYGVIGRRLKFRTMRYGLAAGQILPVTLPEHEINSEMLIESVNISTEQNKVIWYDVSCVEGPEKQSWTKMFEVMATKGQSFVVRENLSEDQVLVTLQSFSKTWLENTPNNIFREVYPSVTLYPSETLYPMFNPLERVLYIELLDSSDNVLLRKRITKQTGSLNSIVFVSPLEAIGTIAKVRWYGGHSATSENGSGILVDEQEWAKAKTSLEALQIDKTDTKGW